MESGRVRVRKSNACGVRVKKGLGLDNMSGLGLGLEMEIVRHMCEVRAQGFG